MMSTFSLNLKILRVSKNISRKSMAQKLNLSHEIYTQKEKSPELFTLPELIQISRILNVSIEELCE